MKESLKKLFFAGSPEKGMFFGIVLLLLGSWLLSLIFTFCGGWMALRSIVRVNGKYIVNDPGWIIFSAAVLLLFLLYLLFQQVCFWKKFSWKESTSACKKWLLSSFCLWAATLICAGDCIFLVTAHGGSDGLWNYIKANGAALPSLLTLALLLLTASVLTTGKFLSEAGNFPYRQIFTLPVKLLAALAAVTYAGLVSGSLILQTRCEAEKAVLEKDFKRPLNADALKKAALGNEKTAAAFWKKVNDLYLQDKNRETHYCFAEFTPSQLASWRKRFESSKVFPELDKMISAPLPTYPWKIEKYNLAAILLTDLQKVRYMTRLQAWHCRFAAEKEDRAAAMAALKRMDNLSSYLSHQPFLISALVKLAVDTYKLQTLENLLGARILTKSDLLALKQQSRMIRKHLAAAERDILWCEALSGLDYMEGAFHAGIWYGIKIVPFNKFRFLLPQFWFIDECNRLNYLRLYRNAGKFYDIPQIKSNSIFYSFARMLTPVYQSAGDKFLQHDLRQQAIEFFIDQEIYRLEHGRLPAQLPLPVDPFSKKPMIYICGKVTVKKEVYEKPSKGFNFSARQLTSASKGKLNVTVTIPDKAPVFK